MYIPSGRTGSSASDTLKTRNIDVQEHAFVSRDSSTRMRSMHALYACMLRMHVELSLEKRMCSYVSMFLIFSASDALARVSDDGIYIHRHISTTSRSFLRCTDVHPREFQSPNDSK
jgi:hypothetical protein